MTHFDQFASIFIRFRIFDVCPDSHSVTLSLLYAICLTLVFFIDFLFLPLYFHYYSLLFSLFFLLISFCCYHVVLTYFCCCFRLHVKLFCQIWSISKIFPLCNNCKLFLAIKEQKYWDNQRTKRFAQSFLVDANSRLYSRHFTSRSLSHARTRNERHRKNNKKIKSKRQSYHWFSA